MSLMLLSFRLSNSYSCKLFIYSLSEGGMLGVVFSSSISPFNLLFSFLEAASRPSPYFSWTLVLAKFMLNCFSNSFILTLSDLASSYFAYNFLISPLLSSPDDEDPSLPEDEPDSDFDSVPFFLLVSSLVSFSLKLTLLFASSCLD